VKDDMMAQIAWAEGKEGTHSSRVRRGWGILVEL